jgi:hypothetical protein
VGSIIASANGINLGSADFTAANGTTIVLNSARNAGDVVRVFYGMFAPATNVNQQKAFSIAMSIAFG